MNNAGGGRHLPILAAALMLAALAVTITLLLLKIPAERRFEESILSAAYSLEEGSLTGLKRDLLRSSRYASSAAQWKSILNLAALGTLPDAKNQLDYRLFRILAGRASASVPGDQDLLASWVWALLRSGNIKKAVHYQENLNTAEWSSLRAEIRLLNAYGGGKDSVESFIKEIDAHNDPEFMENAALLTESAELTFDAALLWMLHGRPEKAYENISQLEGERRTWASPLIASKKGVAEAAAWISYDSGRTSKAVEWIESRIADAQRRRVESWTMMQFLGDLYWKTYELNADETLREKAAESWSQSMELLRESAKESGYPKDSWRLWINSSAAAFSSGRIRDGELYLNEALSLFPSVPEVKASWAKANLHNEPALARRLVRTSETNSDPVLGVTSVIVDPETISPRLYEARMWELFDAVTNARSDIEDADARMITAFVLDYMSSRKNLDSVDVAVDRYRKFKPDDPWVLSWRLASDAVRGIALIDLLPSEPGGVSPYGEFTDYAAENQTWRALHDAALFASHASEALSAGAEYFGGNAGTADMDLYDASLYALLESPLYSPYRDDSPAADRIRVLLREREDLKDYGKTLSSGGRKGREARAAFSATLRSASVKTLENALSDLQEASLILNNDGDERNRDSAQIHYLEALIFIKLNRLGEAMESAEKAAFEDPDHTGARELLQRGTQ